jgi:hypothetical protein
MNRKAETAILLFSRSARHESHSKLWTKEKTVNAHISKQLLSNTFENLKAAPFPVFHFDESLQSGDTFAERLSSGFKHIFDKGYLQVIAVGNDCPDLHPDWKKIAEQLRLGKTILGPDRRGGVYLIGITKGSGFEEIFTQIPWKSNKVFDQLKTHFTQCYLLDSKQDINTFVDVTYCKPLFKQIKKFLANHFNVIIYNPTISNIPQNQLHLRAPPAMPFSRMV